MSLIKSNPSKVVEETVSKAMDHYAANPESNMMESLKILTALKGVGPATASLILAVHDPGMRIFFSDEAYYWICGNGEHVSLKYNMNEYAALSSGAARLIKRLGVTAVDAEKVAFALMREPTIPEASVKTGATETKVKGLGQARQVAKRKIEALEDSTDISEPRRSLRPRKIPSTR
jgi:hypothetical protein